MLFISFFSPSFLKLEKENGGVFIFFGCFAIADLGLFAQFVLQMKILKERDSLAMTAKKLSRDLAKVLTFTVSFKGF